MLENKAQMKLNSTFWVFQKCTNSKLLITKLYKIVIYLHAVQVFKKCPCFLWHSPRFIGDVVETIVELGRYNETIGCHYKLADQRRQSCQERQKLGAAANNCNHCIFTEYSVFLLYFLKGGVHNDLISDHGLLSETFDQNDDETWPDYSRRKI